MTQSAGSQAAADAVDPAAVPQRTLSSGAKMPAVGFGTFGSDHASPAQVAQAVIDAAAVGYRHFDCASVYGNEPEIGRCFAQMMRDGIARDELFITSKLWNDKHAERDVIPSCERSLRDLGVEHLDLYLVHWPFPNFHPPGCSVDSRSPDARPYIHDDYMATWRQMEKLVDQGKVRHIGTSNMTIPKLELVLRDARIRPAVNEMELHPHFQQPALFDYVTSRGIVAVGFCPIGSPNRPERDRTPDDTSPVEDSELQRIAAAHGIHPATLCIKWAVQRGQVPIPFSTRRANILANLRAATADPLSDAEMRRIAELDRNCRLIKGQVFLWKDGQTWEALWDVDGRITPP